MSDAALRLGLVGRGPWGQAYMRTAPRIEGIELCAVAGRDWHGLLGQSLDGAIIATPASTHLEIAARFVAAGVPVLVEKPLCLDLASALRFREEVARQRGLALVDHIHVFSPAYRRLKALSPALGAITRIESCGGRHGPFRPDSSPLWDWGPHDVSMVLDLLGESPRRVSARRTFDERVEEGIAQVVELELEFARGLLARITVGNKLPHTRRFAVSHGQGTLVYDDLAAPKLLLLDADAVAERRWREALAADGLDRLPLDCVLERFRDLIRERKPQPGQLDLAVNVVRVLESAERSLGSTGNAPP